MTDQVRLSPSGPFVPNVERVTFGSDSQSTGSPITVTPATVGGSGSNISEASRLEIAAFVQLVGDAALASNVTLALRINAAVVATRVASVPANAQVPVSFNLNQAHVIPGPLAIDIIGVGTAGTVTAPSVTIGVVGYSP